MARTSSTVASAGQAARPRIASAKRGGNTGRSAKSTTLRIVGATACRLLLSKVDHVAPDHSRSRRAGAFSVTRARLRPDAPALGADGPQRPQLHPTAARTPHHRARHARPAPRLARISHRLSLRGSGERPGCEVHGGFATKA